VVDHQVAYREDHHAWDLNGGVAVRDPTFQEEDHLVQMGKATLEDLTHKEVLKNQDD
jgi:hypothetical protein